MERTILRLLGASVCCLIFLVGCASSSPQKNAMTAAQPGGHTIHLAISANAPDARLTTLQNETVGTVPAGDEIVLDGYTVSPPYDRVVNRILDGNLLKGFKYNYYLLFKITKKKI